ncbi:MAG: amino acid adenylation domain-containing protein [Candidatus Aminicenantes bacterium]|nr:amino acid adenylation domain-containing protein [Candidatus Aminicenantes bacterium]
MAENFSRKVAIAFNQYAEEGEYWLNKFSGELKRTNFPYDYSKANLEKQQEPEEKDRVTFTLTGPCFDRVMELSKGLDHRLYMIVTAVLAALIYRYTGEKDIVIGSPILKQEIEGDYVNTVLALRNILDDHLTFKELLLDQVRQTVTEAHAHQNYPIEVLLSRLNMSMSRSPFPLFDVAVLLENIHEKEYIRHTRPNMVFSFLRSGGQIEGVVEYNPLLYRKDSVARIAGHFKCLLEAVVFNPDIRIREIDLLGEEEKRQLLVDFNNTHTTYPADHTISELFEEQAAGNPGKTAVTYEGEPVTYKQLNEEADCLAAYLHFMGVMSGEPVALMAENTYKVIVALLGILKAGGAYLPVNAAYPEERKSYILKDCNARILLTNDRDAFHRNYVSQVIDLDNAGIYERRESFHWDGSGNDPAYIIYTSGSTGTPKGVMVVHRNVVRLVKNNNFIDLKEGDSILLTGALEFDASTFEIWGALLNGLPLHLVSKDTILSAYKLEKALERNGVSTMWMTSPLFNQMVDANIGVFKGLKNLVVGGDVLSPIHINRVRRRFPGLTVINGYGPTENTTFSITHRIQEDYQENIPIGKPIGNSTAYILDEHGYLAPLGVPGELYVGGDGLAGGYLNNPELTAEKFIKSFSGGPGGRFYKKAPLVLYKTGDLARWLADGPPAGGATKGIIEFLGRIDQQVKIRGYRIEPGEIENRLMRVDFIKEAVVIDRKNSDGEKYLCAYIVVDKTPAGEPIKVDVGELKRILARQLPDYMLPSYFVPLERIPLTANGKVDRKALPAPPDAIGGGVAYVAPRNKIEQALVDMWRNVLGVHKERIGIDADFFDLGGHSLKATVLAAKIQKGFDVRIPLSELFRIPTIRELAGYIKAHAGEKFSAIGTVEEREYYELSSAQKRLYILQQMDAGGTGYHVPYACVLEGELDIMRLDTVFRKLIRRHESLRTSFEMIDEEPVQVIHDEIEFNIEYYNSATDERCSGQTRIIRSFIRPFDLSHAPLLRVGVIKETEIKHILIVDIHHIVTDGTSMELLIKEFKVFYTGEELPPLPVQYKDYARWQNCGEQKEVIRQQEVYWLEQFSGEIPVLELLTDFPRPAVQSFEGHSINFEIAAQGLKGLKELAAREGGTLYMVLLAVTAILLAKLSNQEDIVVGTPIAARRHVDLERIIGMFVNTLALRNFPVGEKRFTAFLVEVKERTLNAFENQDYQFEDLVERVLVSRDPGRNPLFDVIFALQNMEAQTGDIPEVEIPGLRVSPYNREGQTAKFDITLSCFEGSESLFFMFEYCTRLFKEKTVERFSDYFKNIVSSIIENPGRRIKDIEILSEAGKRQLLVEFNDTGEPYPNDKTIPQLFQEQVEETPDHIALGGAALSVRPVGLVSLSYRELHEQSGRLAYYLARQGAGKNDLVGLMMNRSLEMIIAILGILKAGCGYVPLNPNAPAANSGYILDECNVKVLVATRNLYAEDETGRNWKSEIVLIEEFLTHSHPLTRLLNYFPNPSNFAYVIFTSGSMGKPKGVPISHANLSPLLHWGYRHLGLGAKDRFIQNLSYYFDWSVWEIMMALTTGAGLYIAPDEVLMNPEKCIAFMNRDDITVLHVTPTQYQYYLNVPEKPRTLKYLFIGAEKLSRELVQRSFESVSKDCRVFNMYGPTECTIISAVLEIDRYKFNKFASLASVPIGVPVGNIDLFILDQYMNLCPVNVLGELYIAGDCVARGYLNNPELTTEKFVHFHHSSFDLPRIHHSKLYCTGDLCRRMPDGAVEFLGRIDRQVKIRGFRIEPEEIENRLLKHPDVKEAKVLDKTGNSGDKYLCAYIVSERSFPGSELKEYLAECMPGYMIPTYFVLLDRIPLTPNGKVDRKALPEPGITPGEDYTAPGNEIEEKIAAIWSEVLGIGKSKISIDADFFDLGGHSLKVVLMIAKIHKVLNLKLELMQVFSAPTIRGIASLVEAIKWVNAGEPRIDIEGEPESEEIIV